MRPIETRRTWVQRIRLALMVAAVVLLSGQGDAIAQAVIDLCGCRDDPTLRDFNASDPATYPPGTSGCSSPCSSGTLILPVPADGILKFRNFTINGGFTVGFSPNASNGPVTILASGDVLIRGAFGCCQSFSVSGNSGSNGTGSIAGVGGLGGPGGFRGGDGSAEAINGATIGGAGFGPGGGTGATPSLNATGGVFFGIPELLPLVGGSGGGGGSGFGSTTSCTGGGGGGGGGALLIVANGAITLQNYQLFADGGGGASVGNGACARGGAGGSAGAIRLVASRLVDNGSGQLFARGGGAAFSAPGGTDGRIRLESIDPSAQTTFFTQPAAIRVTGPGPIVNPVAPTVRITSVSGTATGAVPQGWRGSIDVVLPAPGIASIDLATSGVPSGTTLEVKVKPRIGAAPQTSVVPLSNCDAEGGCVATTSFNLAAGAYTVEARATFQVQ